jgi:RimJ/RimL family protein N-acetyltransferase
VNIIGEKVILRAIEISDNKFLLDIINDGEAEHLLGGWSFPVSSLCQEEWIRSLTPSNNILRCVAEAKQEKIVLGTVILSDIDYKNGTAELHIKLSKDTRRKGYGTDITRTVVNYSFNELRLHCIYARINDYNKASQKLFERCGFEKEGIMRARIYKNGDYHDIFSYSILNTRKV